MSGIAAGSGVWSEPAWSPDGSRILVVESGL
jgi:Tol biopolymer transport system component